MSIQNDILKACEKGDFETVKQVATEFNVNTKGFDGNAPIHWAVFYDRVDVVKHLLSQGADINIKDIAGKTSLSKSCNLL